MEKLKYTYRAYKYKYKIDSPEINFIIQNLKKGETGVDIGCHKGGYLYWLHKCVGKNGKIYAFEPQRKLYRYLQEISKICDYQNVVIENKGVSDSNGTAEFHIPETISGTSPGARIEPSNANNDLEKGTIEVVSLDKYFLEKQILPSLIKIDVEGHEKQVIQGGLELLKTCKPKLLMECESRHLRGEDIFDVFNLLIEIGYKGYFYENKKLKSISEFKLEIHQKSGEGSFWEKKGYVNNFIFDVIDHLN